MRSTVVRVDRWETTHDLAVREEQRARFQQRQQRLPVETLEWPQPRATLRDQIIAVGLLLQIVWWLMSGKLFRAM